MPELPEVEVVCRELSEMIPQDIPIKRWEFFRADIRFRIPKKKLVELQGSTIRSVTRRAKYILFEVQDCYIVSHLGMTGSWRILESGQKFKKHDHLCFELVNGNLFVFNDPRRFGFIELIKKADLQKRFKGLGVEPLDPKTDFLTLTDTFRKLKAPIKSSLMNQKLIVGVGNIYASEILFAAKVSPLKKAARVSKNQYSLIWENTQFILKKAIQRGGSTIENYKSASGAAGEFQNEFFVYGRESELCRNCHNPIKMKVLSGRSTFWCSSCQK